jgi:hypothetical protein
MKLEKLAKDGTSGDNGCPTVYRAEDGRLVVQGDLVDSATTSELENVLPGEAAVVISADVIFEAMARYHKR